MISTPLVGEMSSVDNAGCNDGEVVSVAIVVSFEEVGKGASILNEDFNGVLTVAVNNCEIVVNTSTPLILLRIID